MAANATDLVIFDCDGVLVDSEPISISVLVEALAAAVAKLGGDVTPPKARAAKAAPAKATKAAPAKAAKAPRKTAAATAKFPTKAAEANGAEKPAAKRRTARKTAASTASAS